MTQEIGSAVEHDKKTAKKQAATQAIDFLLKYTPSTPLVPAPVAPPEGPAASALGKITHKMLHLVRSPYPPLARWADSDNSTPAGTSCQRHLPCDAVNKAVWRELTCVAPI